jgi:hypothetical protein
VWNQVFAGYLQGWVNDVVAFVDNMSPIVLQEAERTDIAVDVRVTMLESAKKMLMDGSAVLPTNEVIFKACRLMNASIAKLQSGAKWEAVRHLLPTLDDPSPTCSSEFLASFRGAVIDLGKGGAKEQAQSEAMCKAFKTFTLLAMQRTDPDNTLGGCKSATEYIDTMFDIIKIMDESLTRDWKRVTSYVQEAVGVAGLMKSWRARGATDMERYKHATDIGDLIKVTDALGRKLHGATANLKPAADFTDETKAYNRDTLVPALDVAQAVYHFVGDTLINERCTRLTDATAALKKVARGTPDGDWHVGGTSSTLEKTMAYFVDKFPSGVIGKLEDQSKKLGEVI